MSIQTKYESLSPESQKQIEDFLDFLLRKEELGDQLLEQSINRGVELSKNNEIKSHDEVMSGLRAKFKT